jgi:hypothetical protein
MASSSSLASNEFIPEKEKIDIRIENANRFRVDFHDETGQVVKNNTLFHRWLSVLSQFKFPTDLISFEGKRPLPHQNVEDLAERVFVCCEENANIVEQAITEERVVHIPNFILINEGDEKFPFCWSMDWVKYLADRFFISKTLLLAKGEEPNIFPFTKDLYNMFEYECDIKDSVDVVTIAIIALRSTAHRHRFEFSTSQAILMLFFYQLFQNHDVKTWFGDIEPVIASIDREEGIYMTQGNPLIYKRRLWDGSGDWSLYIFFEILLTLAYGSAIRSRCMVLNGLVETRYYCIQAMWDTMFADVLYIPLISNSHINVILIPWFKHLFENKMVKTQWTRIEFYTLPGVDVKVVDISIPVFESLYQIIHDHVGAQITTTNIHEEFNYLSHIINNKKEKQRKKRARKW